MTLRIITNGYRYRIQFQGTCGNWFPVNRHETNPWRRKEPWETRWLWKARLRVWLEVGVDDWHEKYIQPIWQQIESRWAKVSDWSNPTVVDSEDQNGIKP